MKTCNTLDEVRQEIDRVDLELVKLIAERAQYVHQVVNFKKTAEDIKVPKREEQVICKVKKYASELGVSERIVEAVYRTMIAEFVQEELKIISTRK
jgi:isochorismate pyruvate lyase